MFSGFFYILVSNYKRLKTIYVKYTFMGLLNESKRFNDFTPEEKRQIFNVFTQSYVKATGVSWDERKFYSRANEWLFFGDPAGFITLRPQRSGYYKLTGVAGSPKSIMRAMQELTATHFPIWGMLTQDLANMLTKRFGFRMPNRLESFVISKLISNNVFGNVEFKRNSDNSITFNYADVGEATKVFVGNREYYKKVRMDALRKVFSRKQENEGINEEVLDEKRAVQQYYEDSFKLVTDYLRRFGYENTYASFRKTANTTFINRNNRYSTPTGFYMYPLKNFDEKISQSRDMKSFMKVFPYTPDSNFCFLFTINNYDNILTSNKIDENKIKEYVNKIKEVYGKQKPSIAMLCDQYLSPEGFKSRPGYSYKNEFQRFWIFLYEVASELRSEKTEYSPDNYRERPSSITIIANAIGLRGFIDDGCMSIIHPGEPCQGVLLSGIRETLGNLKIVPIYQKYDAPLPIDKDAPTHNTEEYKRKYEKYLTGKLKVNNVTILGNEYQTAIKNRLPFIIHVNDYIPYYIDRDGNKTVRGLDVEKIIPTNPNDINQDDELKTKRTAYINSILNTTYNEVHPFGQYGGDVAFAIGDNGEYGFINKQGQPDITGIDVTRIGGSKERAIYFNQLLGKQIYDNVGSFTEFGGEIARARTLDNRSVFVNKLGNEDISQIDVTKLTDNDTRAIVINQKLGKKVYSSIGAFNQYGEGIAVAYRSSDSAKVFINIDGKPSVKGVNILSIGDSDLRAIYFNQKYHKKLFTFVGNFNKYGEGIAVAKLAANGELMFIDALGKSAIDKVNIDNISDANIRAIYINQKFGTNFTAVSMFDQIGDDVATATDDDGNITFINREGKPSMGNVDINKIRDSHVRAVYVNKLLGTKYIHVGAFDEYGDNIAFASNPENEVYEFINREGKKDVKGVDLNKIRDKATRAAYFNQKYGTNYNSVGSFGEYGNDAAIAHTSTDRFFINRNGKPDTSGVNLNDIDEAAIRALYYNQKFGTNYTEINPFGQYGEGIATAYDANSNVYFINTKGKKSMVGVDIDKLPDYMRTSYFNQRFKTHYKSIGTFGQYGEDTALATGKDGKPVFINREGKPDNSKVDFEKLKGSGNSSLIAIYFNILNGTDFTEIVTPVNSVETDIIFARSANGKYMFVNSKGKPTLKVKNLDKIKSYYSSSTIEEVIKTTEKAINDAKKAKKKPAVKKLKENYSVLDLIVNEEIINYFQN